MPVSDRAGPLAVALAKRLGGGGKAFVPYVTAGLPGVDAQLLREIEAAGADSIEIGIPFSDPVMDGGVIQEASHIALQRGFHPRDAFDLAREAALGIPVVFMTYLNPVLNIGYETFARLAADCGGGGVIVPDLPVDEAAQWSTACSEAGVDTVFLAAPDEPTARLREIADASTGFVYCVSTYGVTGARETLAPTAAGLVRALRPLTERPLLVGVGITTPAHADQACAFADGVIVGSALVRRLVAGDREGCLRLAGDFRDAIPA
jgi:tryptophan synthase alpha chain